MNVGKILNWLKWFVGALVVGGLGNGVWEKLLSPFISFLSNSIINSLIELSTRFSDSIYSKAVSSLIDNSDNKVSAHYTISVIILLIILLISILWIYKSRNENFDSQFFRTLGFSFFAMLVMSFILVSRDTYIHGIATTSYKNLEIVRPYIGESKYLQLRSKYLRITTKKEFDIYEEEIIKYSQEHNLNLKKFTD